MHELIRRPHPALVHFPISLYTISFVFLVFQWTLRHPFFLVVSHWLFLFAAFMVMPVALTGIWDFNRLRENPLGHFEHPNRRGGIRNPVRLHLANGVAITLLSLFGFGLFLWQPPFASAGLLLIYTLLLFALTAMVLFQGYLGGLMVYRHHIGIDGETR